MSLINEALKKAQRQRSEGTGAPSPAGAHSSEGSAERVAKRRPPMAANTVLLLLGGGLVVLAMGGVIAYLLLASDSPSPTPVKPASVVASAPATKPPEAPVVVAAPMPSAPEIPAVTVKLPAIPAATAASEPAKPAVVAAPPKPVASPTPAAPVANPRVYEFLETLRISGIRASETDPKVIMNDRVYRLNDMVDRGTQLRLVRVEASALVFADASGFEYKKSL